MPAFDRGTPHPDGYVDIPPSALDSLSDDVRYIDVREPIEFNGDLGHLAHAELVPLGELKRAQAAWDRQTPLLLICRSGRRSAEAAKSLRQVGFANVANLVGGMLAVRGNR